jgi:hypothetical protein
MMNADPSINAIRLTKHRRGVATKLDEILAQLQDVKKDVAALVRRPDNPLQKDAQQ